MPTLAVTLFLLIHSVQSPEPDLATVIHRATEYVTKYEAEVGNLIGTEKYVQTTKQLDGNSKNSVTPLSRQVNAVMTMTTSSDFMLIKVGPQWVPLREVNEAEVNGFKVRLCGEKIMPVNSAECRKRQPDSPATFDNSPEDNTKLFNSLKADSTKYNVGRILRETNLPTFALQVLRMDQVSRFSFEKEGSDKIGGIPLWRVKFRETAGPALVSTAKGEDLYSTGTVWIDPETGKILKT